MREISKVLEFNNNKKRVGKLEIKNRTENKAELYFYGDIVSSEWGKWEDTDTCPEDVIGFLKEVEDVKNLDIFINSGGGSVFAGIAIYNMLKRFKGYKTVYVDALAASISSVIALSGDKVYIPSNAYFMIHKPWSIEMGNADDLRKMADKLDIIQEGIVNVYSENLKEGIDIKTIEEMVNDETWLTGDKAAQYFNVEVSEEIEASAHSSNYFNEYKNTPEKLVKTKCKEPGKPKEQNKEDLELNKLKEKLTFKNKRMDSFLFCEKQGGMLNV